MTRTLRLGLAGLAGLLLLAAFACVGAVLLRSRVAAVAVAHVIRARTGSPVSIHGLTQGWRTAELTFEEMEIGNPHGVRSGRAILLKDTRVRWSLRALLHGRIHLEDLKTRVAVVELLQLKSGATNLDRLHKAVNAALDRGELRIDHLALTLGEVHVTSESSPDHEPLVVRGHGKAYSFRHIETSGDFAGVIHAMVSEELPSNFLGIVGTSLQNAWKDFQKAF